MAHHTLNSIKNNDTTMCLHQLKWKVPKNLGTRGSISPRYLQGRFFRDSSEDVEKTQIPSSIEILYCKYIHTVYQVLPRVFIAFYWVSNTSYDHMSLYQIIKLGISQGYINRSKDHKITVKIYLIDPMS